VSLLSHYLVPAVGIWMLVGLLANIAPVSIAALLLIVLYGTFYGLVEAAGRGRPAAPGSGWQVPSAWVRNVSQRRRMWVWGTLLGPGFATRNPYAGFGFLLLAVAAVGDLRDGVLLAAVIGIAHGTGRALALLRDVRLIKAADYLQAVLKAMYWRMFDGYALLAAAGVAAACLHPF
jgi:hypothetical protein